MTTQHRTYTLEQIKRANADAGNHWFSPDTLRFFSSRISSTTYGPDSAGRVYFVSSERSGFDYDTPRKYSVRYFTPETRGIDTHGEFLAYDTLAQAQAAARRAAREN
jgi:hypothetical protein